MCVCLAPCASDGPCLVGVGVVCRALVTVRYLNAKLKGPGECAGGCQQPVRLSSSFLGHWLGRQELLLPFLVALHHRLGVVRRVFQLLLPLLLLLVQGRHVRRLRHAVQCPWRVCEVGPRQHVWCLLQGCCWEGLCVG